MRQKFRFWHKNQLRLEIGEKDLKFTSIVQWKNDYLPIISPSSTTFVILYTSGIYRNLGVGLLDPALGEGVLSNLGVRGCIHINIFKINFQNSEIMRLEFLKLFKLKIDFFGQDLLHLLTWICIRRSNSKGPHSGARNSLFMYFAPSKIPVTLKKAVAFYGFQS